MLPQQGQPRRPPQCEGPANRQESASSAQGPAEETDTYSKPNTRRPRESPRTAGRRQPIEEETRRLRQSAAPRDSQLRGALMRAATPTSAKTRWAAKHSRRRSPEPATAARGHAENTRARHRGPSPL